MANPAMKIVEMMGWLVTDVGRREPTPLAEGSLFAAREAVAAAVSVEEGMVS